MSFVIVEKGTLNAVFETFSKSTADAVDKEKYEVLLISDYLPRLNETFKGKEKVKIKSLSDLPIPKRQTEGAAGYDLQSSKDFVIAPMQRVLVPTGYAYQIPKGKAGFIKDRSSMAYKHGISTMAGVIDSDYRGEVKVLLINLSPLSYSVTKGDRIAQMVILDHYSEELELVDELDEFDRKGGFGSTGK